MNTEKYLMMNQNNNQNYDKNADYLEKSKSDYLNKPKPKSKEIETYASLDDDQNSTKFDPIEASTEDVPTIVDSDQVIYEVSKPRRKIIKARIIND